MAGGKIVPDKKRRRTATLISVLLAAVVFGWVFVYYFRGLLRLGYVDSAIGTVRTLVDEEKVFAEAHPDSGYACKLSDLSSTEMLRELAKSGRRNGYSFELLCRAGVGAGLHQAFQVIAHPLHADMPVFCSDQSGILRSDYGGSTAKCLESRGPL